MQLARIEYDRLVGAQGMALAVDLQRPLALNHIERLIAAVTVGRMGSLAGVDLRDVDAQRLALHVGVEKIAGDTLLFDI